MSKTTKDETAVTVTETQLPTIPHDYGEFAGQGTDDFSQRERGVPFLKILQAQSPEVVGPQGKVEGARPGMLINTSTQQLYDSIKIVPAARLHVIQEWRPRNQGGGLVAQTEVEPGRDYPQFYKEAMARQEADGRKFGDFWTGEPKKSNELQECYQLFSVVLDADDKPIGMIVVPFASSAISVYTKRFSKRIGQLTGKPPMFAFPIVLTTELVSNDEGSWHNYVITFPVENNPVKSALAPDHPAFLKGAELFKLVKGGEVKADEAGAKSARGDAGGDGGAAF